MNKRLFLRLVAASLLVFSLVAWIISVKITEESLWSRILGYQPLWQQLLAGLILGLFWGFLARSFIDTEFFDPVTAKFREIFSPMGLTTQEIWFVSLCAGAGEELLFRGALQPWWGLWITSVVFVALHGYLSPFNPRLSLYGILMVIAIATLGYLADHLGLLGAMLAHTLIDVVLLSYLARADQPANGEETPPE